MDTTSQNPEIVDVLVVVPLDEEMAALLTLLGKPDQDGGGTYAWYIWRNIRLKDREDGILVAVVPSDWDQLPTARTVQLALGRWSPKYAALVGIGGLIDSKSHLGDVLVARYVQQVDAKRKEVDSGTKHSLVPYYNSEDGPTAANRLKADKSHYQKWQQECHEWLKKKKKNLPAVPSKPQPGTIRRFLGGLLDDAMTLLHLQPPKAPSDAGEQPPELHIDNLATGSAVIDSQKRRTELSNVDRKFHTVETEAAGFLSAVRTHSGDDIITLIIRGASDAASKKGQSDAHGGGLWREYAATNAFRIFLYLLQHSFEGTPNSGGPERLKRTSEIRLSTGPVRITRDVAHSAAQWAVDNSFVLVGEPGVGKSAVAYAAAVLLKHQGRQVVVLTAADLIKNAQVLKQLKHQMKELPIILFIDGLDTVRGENQQAVYDLLNECLEIAIWRVVVAIRRFDLESSPRLQRLFQGSPHPKNSASKGELAKIRHIEIGLLDDNALSQVREQSPALGEFFDSAPRSLQSLLRNPFNLGLAGQLLDSGYDPKRIQIISTQVELLETYWNYRIQEIDTEPSQDLLRIICERMMTIPAMILSRSDLSGAENISKLSDLRRVGILENSNRDYVEFAHPIIFDFAIAKMWLKGERLITHEGTDPQRFQQFIEQVTTRADLLFVIYPSLQMYFARLWEKSTDRSAFWTCILQLASRPQSSPTLQVPAMVVAAQSAVTIEDFRPLHLALQREESDLRDAAANILQRLISAFISLDSADSADVGFMPWCKLAAEVCQLQEWKPRDAARRLLSHILERQELSSESLTDAGRAARLLFEWAWNTKPQASQLLAQVVGLVCRTAASSPVETVALLRRLIEPQYLLMAGYETLPQLARSLQWILPHDPAFVSEVYGKAFEHREVSDEKVNRGGPVFGLITNRKQDYESGLYQLNSMFPKFIEVDPSLATHALISVLIAFKLKRDRDTKLFWEQIKEPNESMNNASSPTLPDVINLTIEGREAKLRRDFSAGWDNGLYKHENELQMLTHWTQWIDRSLKNESTRGMALEIIKLAIFENELESVWMRILAIACNNIELLGRLLLPVALNPWVITLYDRRKHIIAFLLRLKPLLSPAECEVVAASIRSIPDQLVPELRQFGEYVRDEVFSLWSGPAKAPASNDDSDSEDSSSPIGEPDDADSYFDSPSLTPLRRPDEPSSLRAVVEPVVRRRETGSLVGANIDDVRAELRALHSLLTGDLKQIAGDPLRDHGWGALASVARMATQQQKEEPTKEFQEELKRYLLDASSTDTPRPSPNEPVMATDGLCSWPYPAARLEAATGLCLLMKWLPTVDEDVGIAIARLAVADPCSMVRYQIASNLGLLKKNKHELFQRIGTHIAENEASGAVIHAFLKVGLRFFADDLAQAKRMLERILSRLSLDGDREDEEESIQHVALSWYLNLYAYHEDPDAEKKIRSILSQPSKIAARRIPNLLFSLLTLGLEEQQEHEQNVRNERARRKAWEIMNALTLASVKEFKALIALNPKPESLEGKNFLSVQHVLNEIAKVLWHKLESYEVAKKRQGEHTKLSPSAIRIAVFEAAEPIAKELAQIGIPAISEQLLKALGGALEFAPKKALLLVSEALRAASGRGVASDAFALHSTLEFVRTCLSEHRALLQRDIECRQALIQILDLFVDMGWPEAQKLVFQLHEIFR